jgi:hypothetical protein
MEYDALKQLAEAVRGLGGSILFAAFIVAGGIVVGAMIRKAP